MVTKLDHQVGEIVALLKTLKLDDNTILMFSGDNGPQGTDEGNYNAGFFNSTGGLRGLKRSVYEGGIREPMIIRWPGRIKAGSVDDLVWSHYDLFPTFAEVAKTTVLRALMVFRFFRSGWTTKGHVNISTGISRRRFMQAVRMGN